jgi:hypothetical protein
MRLNTIKTVAMTLLLTCILSAGVLAQEEITIMSWNLENNGADSATIVGMMSEYEGVDIWGLCEVSRSWEKGLEAAAEAGGSTDYTSILSQSGRADRMLILYDEDRFDLIESLELDQINPGMRVRSPLVAHLANSTTGEQFLFMVNHLYRSDDEARHTQSTKLNDWAEEQTLPIIAVGDYNYDWRVSGGDSQHDLGYDNITKDDVFQWLRPEVLDRTQYSRSFPASVLDFVFLADRSNEIHGSSEIIVKPGDFPDNDKTPDHRPLRASILLTDTEGDDDDDMDEWRRNLLERIARIEQELEELRLEIIQQSDSL